MDRSGRITNGFLLPIQDRIEIIPGDPTERLRKWASENAVQLGLEAFGTAIDWSSLSHYEMDFDYEGSEHDIGALLRGSDLRTCGRLVVLTSHAEPLLLVTMEVFVEYWYSFWAASGYLQLIVLSENGRCFMEFEDNSFVLYSNFKIR